MTGSEWADIISAGNDAFLRTYSTVTQKPVATVYPNSVMGALVGSSSQPINAIGGAGIILALAVIVGAVVIFRGR